MPVYNYVIYDKNTDYQKKINEAVARGDYTAAGVAEARRNAKIKGEGLTGHTPTYKYSEYTNKTYNGQDYNLATDYGLLAEATAAAGDTQKAKEYEKSANAKISGEKMNLPLRNKYGSLTPEAPKQEETKYSSEYTDKIDQLFKEYDDSIKNMPEVSLPSYSAPSYNSRYDAQIDGLLNKLLNRGEFTYNAEIDPLYQQYKDMYTAQGKLASEDTMGQAAALTGGYGSTYAQSVGQQQYNAYLQKLNEMLPEFYDRAFSKYTAEGDEIRNLYNMYLNRDAVDYQRYQGDVANSRAEYEAAVNAATFGYQQQQDKLNQIRNLLGTATDLDATEYQKYLDKINTDYRKQQDEYQRSLDKWNMDFKQNQLDYERDQTAQGNARSEVEAILAAGGMPSSGLISQSGLSPEYISTLKNYYTQQAAAKATGKGGGTGGRKGSGKKYSAKDNTVINKKTQQITYQPDEGSAELLAALYNGEITPTEYERMLRAKEAAAGQLKAK